MKELAKISGLTFLVMFLIWACKPDKDQPSVQNEKNNMQAKASNNASWQGILSSNKSTFEPKMDTVRRALMGIMHDAQVTQIIKEFMNDNSSDSTFDFRITLKKLNELCAQQGIVLHVKLGQKLCAEYPGKGLPEMCSSITKYMDNGIELSGNVVFPELWIPYYDNKAFDTPTWNYQDVNRITVNNPYSKQNEGLQYWNTDGSTGYINNTTSAYNKIQWILDWNGIPENERPFVGCRCEYYTTGAYACVSRGLGSTKCGVGLFNLSCSGDCSLKLTIADPS